MYLDGIFIYLIFFLVHIRISSSSEEHSEFG